MVWIAVSFKCKINPFTVCKKMYLKVCFRTHGTFLSMKILCIIFYTENVFGTEILSGLLKNMICARRKCLCDVNRKLQSAK